MRADFRTSHIVSFGWNRALKFSASIGVEPCCVSLLDLCQTHDAGRAYSLRLWAFSGGSSVGVGSHQLAQRRGAATASMIACRFPTTKVTRIYLGSVTVRVDLALRDTSAFVDDPYDEYADVVVIVNSSLA